MRVAVLTVSDRVAAGARDDAGQGALCELLEGAGASLVSRAVVADEREPVTAALRAMAADAEVVLTTGGTGLGPRDVTPEATAPSSTARPPASPRPCATPAWPSPRSPCCRGPPPAWSAGPWSSTSPATLGRPRGGRSSPPSSPTPSRRPAAPSPTRAIAEVVDRPYRPCYVAQALPAQREVTP